MSVDTNSQMWALASDGTEGAYAAQNGLVAGQDVHGLWVAYIPPAGATYRSRYLGNLVSVINAGDGSYWLDMNGTVTRHAYERRWLQFPFYDAAGNGVQTADEVRASGDPIGVYFSPGPVIIEGHAVDEVPQGVTETNASNGDLGAFAGPAGMVAKTNEAGYWFAYKPEIGAVYRSKYWGMDVQVTNRDDASYFLVLNGAGSVRNYDQRWRQSLWFDAAGAPIDSPAVARAPGDPQAVYFAPGPDTFASGTGTPPLVSPGVAVSPGAPVVVGPVGPVYTPPAVTPPAPGPTVTPGTLPPTAPQPRIEPFPVQDDGVTPGAVSADNAAILARLAIGALALFSLTK